ncbi:F-box/FBD/LRR-repeat protein At4g26340-like [Lotus japonicus]|uniref:F-box/FBD/LRR-repeat protein At4g26340-like n=1 Tax=Lotus japonicus TaxID=34305 RepID=UPI00258325E6|nr:F-box/FBD/LRR-repeat protein At4g26340-like [Lotus japonicus]XP_057436461.1 F-box/FBD/LRR-repeat protein At4g26340-like [Lotus japonicus]
MANDRISTLPDEALYHILSFLPTQMAAATSILSKRWTPLWLSVPSLFFDDQSYLRNHKPYLYFTKFIYATILDRDVPIRMFRLQCEASSSDLSGSDLKIWIKAAIQRGLENLYILLPPIPNVFRPNLSSCIFCCKTLVVLKLVGLNVDEFSSVDLPSLKTLHFHNVVFQEPHYFLDLLAGCPILEYMHLTHVYYIYADAVDYIPSDRNFGSLSKLVRAEIHSIDFDTFVESLGIDKYLEDIPIFPSLTHLELMWWGCKMNWPLVLSMLKQCPMLQNFVLNMETSTDFDDVVWISPPVVPECLSSQLRKCSMTNYEGTKSELNFAEYVMQNSRALQTMTISTRCSSELMVDKLELFEKLSSCPRSSRICELSFT